MLSLASILSGGIGRAIWNIMPAYYAQYVPLAYVGSMLSANYVWSTIGFTLNGWFKKRLEPRKILLLSEVYPRAISILAIASSTLVTPFIMTLHGLMYAPGDTAKQHLLHIEFTDEQRATMDSINSLLTSCVYAIFLVLVGCLVDKYNPSTAIFVCNAILIPVFFIYKSTFRRNKGRNS
jgi:MFS family permease